MSPWDCQPKTAGRKSGSPATAEDEIQLGTYIPIEDDWPGNERPQGNMEVLKQIIIPIYLMLFRLTVNAYMWL